jgi:AraC-like DNA-binding protein
VRLYGRILQAAATTTGCAHIGLLLGEGTALENIGELRFLLLNAATVRQAFDHLVRFIRLTHQPLRVRVDREQDYTGLAIALVEKVPGEEHILVGYTASAVKALRIIIGAQWNPSMVHLALRRPNAIEPYRRFFRAPVLFDQREYAILFPDSILDAPRSAGDPRLAEFIFERLCLLEGQAPRDLVGQVRHAIETQLLRGECDVVRVAGLFSIHRKTLHGYLQGLGTSFEALRDETRNALAVRMLQHTNLPIAEIAVALGYSNQAALTRAFRRWHGQSPREWRKKSVGSFGAKRAALRYGANAGRSR